MNYVTEDAEWRNKSRTLPDTGLEAFAIEKLNKDRKRVIKRLKKKKMICFDFGTLFTFFLTSAI